MNEHKPDRWVLLKITKEGESEPIYKIFGTWFGSYLQGDSWRANSGIAEVIKANGGYCIIGPSGSSYRCLKGNYGTSGYTGSVIRDWEEQNTVKITIEVLEEREALKYLEDMSMKAGT